MSRSRMDGWVVWYGTLTAFAIGLGVRAVTNHDAWSAIWLGFVAGMGVMRLMWHTAITRYKERER